MFPQQMKYYFNPTSIKDPKGEQENIDVKKWFCWFCITENYELEWYYLNPADGKIFELVKLFL